MRPDNPRSNGPVVPQRQSAPIIPHNQRSSTLSHDAAANIVRSQIDTIYDAQATSATTEPAPVATPQTASTDEAPNPYERTHTEQTEVQADQWNKYHSAWQDYYQKYYERYYIGQVYKAREALEANLKSSKPEDEAKTATEQAEETFSRDEAMYDLKSKLLNKLQTSAKKLEKAGTSYQ